MDAWKEKLYSELRSTQKELIERLDNPNSTKLIRPYISAELQDIEAALAKMEVDSYGYCEFTGDIIPYEALMLIPTIKTGADFDKIDKFYCKSIY